MGNFDHLVIDIERARAGDVMAALGLLRTVLWQLEHRPESPLPEPLRLYLIDAFREIASPAPLKQFLQEEHKARTGQAAKGAVPIIRRMLADIQREEEGIAKLMGDANKAFHLKKK